MRRGRHRERGVALARGERLELDGLMVEPDGDGPRAAAAGGLQDFLDAAAAERIRLALEECGGVRAKAARRLGIDRTTLYRLMRKYEIGG